MKKLIIVLLVMFFLLCTCVAIGSADTGTTDETENETETTVETEVAAEQQPMFLDGFAEYGYTEEQIREMRTVLLNVGITDITEPEIEPVVYGMQVIQGKVYNENRKDVDVQVNIENGVIYLITVRCSNTWTALKGLVDERADLYYDVDGGYVRKIDWNSNTVVEY